jgi:hypothetical protein
MTQNPPARSLGVSRNFSMRNFTNGALIETSDARRAEVEAFVARIYRAHYGAELKTFLPHMLAFHNDAGALQAAVGLRCGNEGPLFVEQYLEVPADIAIAEVLGNTVAREQIVEVGNFGALTAGDSRELILNLTFCLHSAGFRWVLFTATRQLRNVFDRLHLGTVELADATASRLVEDRNHWGHYYATQPKLMFGDIAAGHAWLLRSQHAPKSPLLQPPLPCLATGAL